MDFTLSQRMGYGHDVHGLQTSAGMKAFVPNAFVFFIVLYMLTALVQELLPFSLNRVFGVAIVAVLGYDYVSHFSAKRALAICAMGLLFVINVGIFTTDVGEEMEFYMYWVAALLVLCYAGTEGTIRNLREVITRHGRIIGACAAVSAFLVMALLMTNTGYEVVWGSGSYFSGFCNSTHTMASVCCLVMSLAYLCVRTGGLKILPAFFILIVMSWAMMQTGARTFLVPSAIIWILFLRDSVCFRWLRSLIYTAFIVGIIYTFTFTGMAAKFIYLFDLSSISDSFLSAFTSGRNEYWTTDFSVWIEKGPLAWFLGGSASSVYDANLTAFHMRIWAHDDFVMVLCSTGLIGLALYVSALKVFFSGVLGAVNRFIFLSLLIFVLFPAIINGFYTYQHLVYATVFLVCSVAKVATEKSSMCCPI